MGNKLDQIEKPQPESESSVNKTSDEVNHMIHNEKDMTALEKSTEMIKGLTLIDNEAVSKPIRKYKPPTLTPEAIRSLLEYRFKVTFSNEASNFEFLKYLFVSKRFVNAAGRFPLFCLAVDYRSKDVVLRCTNLLRFKLPFIKGTSKFSKVLNCLMNKCVTCFRC